jgi:WS/DGAT/MGAT family acyltransferase
MGLSSSDSIMWRIEADPVLRSPIIVVGLLDREPGALELRRAVQQWSTIEPRLRQRAVVAPRLRGGSHWVDDEHFSLDFHLRTVRAPRPGDVRSLLHLAEPTATAPFDPARPPWDLTLVEGLDGGRAGLILRFHHTITDGVGGVALANRLFDLTRSGRRRSRDGTRATTNGAALNGTGATDAAPGNRVTEGAALDGSTAVRVDPVGRALEAVGRLASGSTRVAAGVAGAARAPRATIQSGWRVTRSVGRALAPAPAPLSPLFTGRGLDRQLDVLEVPLAGLRHAAAEVGCSINDVFLATVGGALHDHHARLGHPVAALRFTMPISLRTADDPQGGNRFAPARFVLPIDDPDLRTRARIAHGITRRWRDEPALGLTAGLAGLLDLLPGPVVTRIFATMLENIDVDAVDVPGLDHDAYFAGARVERLWAFAPPTGAALSVTLLSHGDTACVGVNCDRQAVPSPELLVTCLEAAFDELLDLPGPADGAEARR